MQSDVAAVGTSSEPPLEASQQQRACRAEHAHFGAFPAFHGSDPAEPDEPGTEHDGGSSSPPANDAAGGLEWLLLMMMTLLPPRLAPPFVGPLRFFEAKEQWRRSNAVLLCTCTALILP
ncbi:uncharacterized protein PAN0_017d5484 [Moesziomyces antarcticus]|uniref:Uncharacterized protein n=2 Tax=Pseudozyma antarctica TaxID=84753 RepID=A0A5C3FV03_PSEA2|nr:uncharacterized protein PAN0_017d5484 [Moesziomyces antarcticus]GAK67257.1 hypothetical protein PAN0_017d5484 [Moesziomyces antarcticus]SPO48132.1 uncharacterized protein PSANT_05820 [Moesziomyces antarcticus]